MRSVKATQARSNFFKMLSAVQERGSSFEIVRNDLPIAELRPINQKKQLSEFFGLWSDAKGQKFSNQLLKNIKQNRKKSNQLSKSPLDL